MSADQGAIARPVPAHSVEIPLLPAAGLSAATAGAFLLGAAGMLGTATVNGVPCLFAAATGTDCPFCGLTHGVAALGAGDVGAALAQHPLAPLAVGLALAVPFVVLRGRRLAVPWAAPWVLALLVTTVWLARVL